MHTCKDALLTVFKGHIVAVGCKEIDIEGNIIIVYTTYRQHYMYFNMHRTR